MKIGGKLNSEKRSIILIIVMLLFVLSSINSYAYAENNRVSNTEEIISSYSHKNKSGGFDNSYRYYGDVNNDTQVNMLDVTLVQKNIAKLKKFDVAARIASDVDGNQKTDMVDITVIQRYIAKLTDKLPAGKLFHVIY
ncbi:MAG: hypothetical protein K6F76_04550 [Clostridiales bacterium]|nr:hypothetical protein [Clostridiales bacterium]